MLGKVFIVSLLFFIMSCNEDGLSELRIKLCSAVEGMVESEAEKLRRAVESERIHGISYYTCEGGPELLIAAGLLRKSREVAGLHKSEVLYEITSEGNKLYEQIFGERKS